MEKKSDWTTVISSLIFMGIFGVWGHFDSGAAIAAILALIVVKLARLRSVK